ncbi:MAG: TetR/AcrR family transcriptional regulator C-terminal domain-containing protein [Acidobacteria bacterium]|nr:TetR/AcrR family transcriptional regulator C-terminal domain-containing protein [Acidobacteriota bacterium]
MASRKRRTAARPRLTKHDVIAAALRLLDSDGIEALSMRRLAAELGIEAMSLYSHVDSKDALLTSVLDLAIEELPVPSPADGDWKDWVRAWMQGARQVFSNHPNLFHVIRSGTALGPGVLGKIDALMARLHAAGFDSPAQLRIWHLLRAYLFGTLTEETISSSRMSLGDLMACCPHLVPVLTTQHCCDSGLLFGEGLEVILAGITTARRA